jgi:hypothetical protein
VSGAYAATLGALGGVSPGPLRCWPPQTHRRRGDCQWLPSVTWGFAR